MASIKPLTVPTKRLAASITASASSFQLSDIESWLDGTNLTSADFGTVAYAVFRNATGSQIEIMEIDPATIASASITINKRGLGYDGDLTTESSSRKFAWNAGTYVELGTHVPQLFKSLVDIYAAQTIAGVKTFSELPRTTAGDPIAAEDLARKAYVDSLVLGTLTTINVIVPGTAGETITIGQLVYFDDTQNKWYKTDADTAASVQNVLLGIAQGAGTANNAITDGVLLQGVDDNQSGLTIGQTYYASNTAGAIASSPGTTEVTVGIGKSATELYFAPRFDQQITEDMQDALNSTTAANATNKYSTQKDMQIAAELYAADAGANDTYAITLSPAPAAYVDGMTIRFKANTANTGAATLNVNSLGAKTIKKYKDVDLADGDIKAGQIVEVVYDGTNFQLVGDVQRGVLCGVISSVLATTAGNNDQTVTTTFTPKTIILDYWIQGRLDGTYYQAYRGRAVYDGTTLKSNSILWHADQASDNTEPQTSSAGTYLATDANGASAPTAGAAGSYLRITLTINSVSSTGFVVRCATDGAGSYNARAKIAYQAYE